MQNTYKSTKTRYLINLFDFLFQDNDVPISIDDAIQETLQNVIDIDNGRLDLDLDYLEFLIKSDSLAYVRKGAAFTKIKINKSYKRYYSTFEEYCINVLGKSPDAINNAIDAARVCFELIMYGYEYEDLPDNMSQAVQLKEFTGPELKENWDKVLENIPRHKRTADAIRALLYPPPVTEKTLDTRVELDVPTFTKLQKIAYDAKLSAAQVISAVVQILPNKFKKSDIYRLLRWNLDLLDLVSNTT